MTKLSLFQKLADENNLRKAWIKSRYHASTSFEYYDVYEYELFENNLDENLASLRYLLVSNLFEFEPFRIIEIPKKVVDKRKLYFPGPKENTVIQAILNIIGPVFEDEFSEFSYGNRLNYLDNESKDPFLDRYEQYYLYMTQALGILALPSNVWYQISDISNYYPSIDKAILKGVIAAKIDDADLLQLIDKLFAVKAINLFEQLEDIPGLPPGPIHAHFFANVYLDVLDKMMSENALVYARYVDDFCYACKSEEELRALEGSITSLFDTKLGGLRLSGSKTETQPLINPTRLIEHTRKLKYDLRFGVIESIDTSLVPNAENDLDDKKRKAEALFRDFFLKVEKEDDIGRIASESAGFIAKKLLENIVTEEQAINIAFGILDANPPRTSAVRALLACIMQLSVEDAPERLIEFLANTSEINKITFLQLLLSFKHVNEKINQFLKDTLYNDENYLVRANSFLALNWLDADLSIESIRGYREKEKSFYVLSRLVINVSRIKEVPNHPLWPEIRAFLAYQSIEVVRSVINVLIRLFRNNFVNQDTLSIIFPIVVEHPNLDIFSLIQCLTLVSQFGNTTSLSHVYKKICTYDGELCLPLLRISASKTSQSLLSRGDLSGLFRFSDSLVSLGFVPEAIIGYQELASKSSDPELQSRARESRDKLGYAWHFPGLPNWYKWDECDKGLYCELGIEPDYTCRYFEDRANNRKGTLEIISIKNLLENKDFTSADTWFSYVDALQNKGVVNVIAKGILPDDDSPKLFVIYEYLGGYLPLREWISIGRLPEDEKSILEITKKIAEAVENTRFGNSFQFQNINLCNVLWNPIGDIQLINLGASLFLPRYVCGIDGCDYSYYQEEVGVTARSFFLGMLLLQLLTKNKCPIKIIEKGDSKINDDNSLQSEITNLRLAPHTRSLLSRMLQRRPELRYPTISLILDDINDIIIFLTMLESNLNLLDETAKVDLRRKLTLVDYVTFRLKIIGRNPKTVKASPIIKVNHILEQLSDDLLYYSQSDLLIWETRVSWFRHRDKLPDLLTWNWLSPEGRGLIGIAFGWLNLLDYLKQKYGIKYPDKLMPILLSRVAYIESLAFVQSLIVVNGNQSQIAQECKKRLDRFLELPIASLQSLSMKRTFDTSSNPIRNPFSHEYLQEASEIITIAFERKWTHFITKVNSITSLFAIVVILGFETEFIDENGLTTINCTPIIDFGKKNVIQDLWITTKLPVVIESVLEEITSREKQSTTVAQNEFIQDIKTFLQYLHSVNPCKRIRGKLLDYLAYSVPREGKIQLGWIPLEKNQKEFSERFVFTWGDFYKAQGSERAIQIDILKTMNNTLLSSIFSATKLFQNLQNDSNKVSIISRLARWMNTRRKINVRIVVFLATFLITLFIYIYHITQSQNAITSSKDQPIYFIYWLGNALIGNVLWDSLKAFLPLFNPEDTKVIEVS